MGNGQWARTVIIARAAEGPLQRHRQRPHYRRGRCRGVCDSLKRTLRLCQAVPAPDVPGGLQQAIRSGIRQLLEERRMRGRLADSLRQRSGDLEPAGHVPEVERHGSAHEPRPVRMGQALLEHLDPGRARQPPRGVGRQHAGDVLAEPAPGQLVGTGALQHLSADHAELKSMRSAESLRGLGVGRAILEHILGQAVDLGYQRVSLETGSQPFFEPAYQLYRRYGFTDCEPFGSYVQDRHSRFMTRVL